MKTKIKKFIPKTKYQISLSLNLITANYLIWVVLLIPIAQAHINNYFKKLEIKPEIKKEIKKDAIEPEIGTKAWAMQKWANRFGEKVAWQLEVIMDTKESGWDANAYHCNSNGTVDLSWYQINSVHVKNNELSLECASSPVCSTDFAMDLYSEQGWCPWNGAKALGFCK